MMSSVFTSCVMRTRTLGNQSFCFQSIFTTTMNVNLPTPSTCSMMMDSNNQPIYLQYCLAPNFTSHIMRTRSTGKLRSFFHFSSICSTTNEYHENKDPTSELHHLHLQPFFIIVITSSHTTLILVFENNGF